MKNKGTVLNSLLIMLAGLIHSTAQAPQKPGANTSCGQNQANPPQDKFTREHNGNSQSQIKELATSKAPMSQVRHIKQARNGDILIAASWSGAFRYDGKSFT